MSEVDSSASSSVNARASAVSIRCLRKVLTDKGVGPAQWMEVGTQLELDHNTLEMIEYSNPRSPERCMLKVLHCWTKKQKHPTQKDFESAFSPDYRPATYTSERVVQERPNKIYIITALIFATVAIILGIVYLVGQSQRNSMPQSLQRYVKNLRAYYRSESDVTDIEVLWYDFASIKFVPPVLYELDLRKDSQPTIESEELYFDDFFRYTGLGQRILIQARPGSGKTTLANRLTKEWSNQKKNTKITECPILLRVKLRELRPSGETLSLSDILRYSMSDDIEHIDEELEQYLSEPENATGLCIIFDGLDEYPPAYNDPSNYIYKIINGQKLLSATVIVLSRPEAYKAFFESGGKKGFPVYELTGFNSKGITKYVTSNIPDLEHAERFISYLDEKPAIRQLCTSPLHLTMFVESYNIKYEFPSTLTKAYSNSLSKAIKREIHKSKLGINCSSVDLSSLRECSHLLANIILNVSWLAFKNKFTYDPFLEEYLCPNESFGLLSRHCRMIDGVKQVCKCSFPHKIIQNFWAAFYAAETNHNVTLRINYLHFIEHNFLPFYCGMHSSRNNFTTFLQVLIKIYWFDDYVMCGFESGLNSRSLADIYLEHHDSVQHFSPPYKQKFQSVFDFVLLKTKHLRMTQRSRSLRLHFENITDVFPYLEKVSIYLAKSFYTNFTCSTNLTDNLRLISSGKTNVSILEFSLMSYYLLIDQNCLDCLNGVIDTEIEISLDIDVPVFDKPNPAAFYPPNMVFIELTPDMLISSIEIFSASFPNLTGLRVLLKIQISSLECQFIQALFENLYASSLFSKIRIFQLASFDFKSTLESTYLLEDSYTEVVTERILLRDKEMEMLVPVRRYSRIKRIAQCLILTDDENMKLCTARKATVYTYKPKQ